MKKNSCGHKVFKLRKQWNAANALVPRKRYRKSDAHWKSSKVSSWELSCFSKLCHIYHEEEIRWWSACLQAGSRSEKKRDPSHKADHVKATFVMHQKRSKKKTVMLLLPISTRRSTMPTGSLPLNEIATWLKSHTGTDGDTKRKNASCSGWMFQVDHKLRSEPHHQGEVPWRDRLQSEPGGSTSCIPVWREASVISRKNSLFCKTPSGAQATATVFGLIETA